ncbi:MAG: hypothetical protein A2161_07265 [Candidatus Schekmanbacteria bacterium RBG_13_48_7]|uniref:Methyltransferase domain-containing protein n=1 Tax=Candidatus Schekmanbacteria bacterium RBG_13_48_7 TaxID=1817878 RepID=A0A1F7RUB7_9BACT|nr:MAG: hypothetical protein A2161_07265 [Candidatus Schekmanbacteria bacterium RBG_13_48_7]
MKNLLSLENIDFEPSSYVDNQGFVFYYDDKVLRCIYSDAKTLFQGLLKENILEDWSQRFNLVPTRSSQYRIAGKEDCLIVEHDRIWPTSYCTEWCPSMLYDAAHLTINFALELADHELILQDAYPWNILFCGSEPVFIDLTSIAPVDPVLLWPAHEQFEAFFIRPIILSELGKGKVARAMLRDYINGISLEEYYKFLGPIHRLRHPGLILSVLINKRLQRSAVLKDRLRKMSEKIIRTVPTDVRKRFLKKLSRRLNIFKKTKSADAWTRYYKNIDKKFDKAVKRETVSNIIRRIKPETLLDIGCNTGIFSIEAAQCGAKVVSIDTSESCVEELYCTASQKKLHITPLIADIVNPTPAYGFLGRQFPGLLDRIGCEMVLFLGMMHHAHVTGRQSIMRISELLNIVTQKYLLFEYIDIKDANMPHLPQRRKIEYSIETIKKALEKYFENIEDYPSDRQTRRLLLCTK